MQKLFYSLTTLLIIFFIIVAGSEYSSLKKVENLQHEEKLSTTVYNLDRTNLDLANIQYRGMNTRLRHSSDALEGYYDNDFASKLFKTANIFQTIDYKQELSKLKKDISNFNIAAGQWYTQENIEDVQHQANREKFTNTYTILTRQINSLSSENDSYSIKRHTFFAAVGVPLLLLTLIIGLLYRRESQRKKELLAETTNLKRNSYTVQAGQSPKHVEHTIKTPQAINPSYLDVATGINNDKGFMHEYNEHKGQNLRNYTAICLFSIDKLDEMEANFPAEFSESILKKVGFMLALYHHDRDIIGRIAHNRFAIMLSREEKSSAVNDCELIRKSVEGNQFTTEGGQELTITISGGFVQKESTQNINEILTKANKVLSMSIQHGGNRIAQLRDKNAAMK